MPGELVADALGEGYDRLPAEERITRATGEGLTDRDFIAYLQNKYLLGEKNP